MPAKRTTARSSSGTGSASDGPPAFRNTIGSAAKAEAGEERDRTRKAEAMEARSARRDLKGIRKEKREKEGQRKVRSAASGLCRAGGGRILEGAPEHFCQPGMFARSRR